MVKIRALNHGRETYAVYYGDGYVLKRPLPTMGVDAQNAWLAKQHRTKQAIDRIRAVGNPVYNVPSELKFDRLDNFVETKMSNWFTKNEVRQMSRIRDEIGTFEYTTRMAWSHCDLNSGNVLYDPATSKISFIDFAEAGYRFIYRDIFAPLQIELDICKPVYEVYCKMHNKHLWQMPSIKNDKLREIMKYRTMVVWLKRFIKAADDLRKNPQNQKSINNNAEKIAFMREQMAKFQNLERQLSR